MNCFRWFNKGPMLIALLGMTFLGAYRAQAQEAKPIAAPVQAEDPFAVPERFARYDGLVDGYRIAGLWDSADDMLGANLQPVGEALRAQLDLPAGQGLVVEGLRGDGACAWAGLQQNDILLSVADKPLGTVGDLIKQLKAAGDSPVALKILHGGKPVTITVRPIYRVTLGPVGEQKTEYYIGISVVGLNDAMRAQLGLAEGKGMVVSEIEKGSPAEKAGLKKYDIVLQLDGKPIDSPETLQRQVQAARDHQATLELLRAGKPVTIFVVAATRKVEAPPNPEAAYRLLFLNRTGPAGTFYDLGNRTRSELGLVNTIQSGPMDANGLLRQTLAQTGQSADANDLRQRLDHLEKELAAVRAALDKINETLKGKNENK